MVTRGSQSNPTDLCKASAENDACSPTDAAARLNDHLRKLRDLTQHLQKLISQCDLLKPRA
jgi:hypothetical protein